MSLDINKITKELQKEGLQWGDAVAWVTRQLGITKCPPCTARQEILNQASKNGLIATIKKIKETL